MRANRQKWRQTAWGKTEDTGHGTVYTGRDRGLLHMDHTTGGF